MAEENPTEGWSTEPTPLPSRVTENIYLALPDEKLGAALAEKLVNPLTLVPNPEIAKVLAGVRGNLSRAAYELGVARSTLQKYLKENPVLQTFISDLRAGQVDGAEDILLEQLRADPKLLMFYLRTQGRDRGYATSAYADQRVLDAHERENTVGMDINEWRKQQANQLQQAEEAEILDLDLMEIENADHSDE